MAKRTSLRDFQQYLAGRFRAAAHGRGTASLLGVRAGERDWLLDLADSGEIIPVQATQLTPVPLSRPWFAGLANIRGNLHAVTDLAAFLGGKPTPLTADARLVLVGSRHGSNAALLVGRSLGLRKAGDFEAADPDPAAPPWSAQRYRDREGKLWSKLAVRPLLADDHFMNIGI